MYINTVGVVGAGTMGNGIAQTAAVAGLNVAMIDVSDAALEKGVAALKGSLERLVSKNKLAADARDAALSRLTTSTDYAKLAEADIVIEAATENVELKGRILKQIEAVARPDAIIATNTSSISITALAALLADPSRFVGMHFFNPAPLMPLVEIIRGLQTSDATVSAVRALTERFEKSPIGVRNAPGFVVNRILVPMIIGQRCCATLSVFSSGKVQCSISIINDIFCYPRSDSRILMSSVASTDAYSSRASQV